MWRLLTDFQKMTKVFQRRQKLEKVSERQSVCCYLEKTKVFSKRSPPLEYTFAGFVVSCCI
jgi:hypothetical protein